MTSTEFLLLTAQSSPGHSVGVSAPGHLKPKGFDDGFLIVEYQVNTTDLSINSLIEILQDLKKSLAVAAKLRQRHLIDTAKAFETEFLKDH